MLSLQILVTQPDGRKMVVATLSEGNYFGEISLLKLDSGQNKLVICFVISSLQI